ncbi:type II toxin-antitoxin system RelE family toxin [Methanobrevibacter filiformis]|uniref:Plasmid stabilization system protein n=1 Tax=Methanobrevibacter filiformis TaxID=55758 RepID=A0A162FIS2_9EURY|nr:type II toxin-antitoxin system RelE/ParE family toxin [Methanobrevibacter filiformis]KZX10610.1 plasmid stabilization system protein [Methanobrevibacter filiformis]
MSLKKNLTYKLTIKPSVKKYLLKLSKKNKKDVNIILKGIEDLINNPYNSDFLKDSQDKERKIRKGNYRILFLIFEDEKQVEILKIGKRSNIYKK